MKSIFTPNKSEGENSCKCCIYREERENGLYCILKNKETEYNKKCRKFEFDISVKSVKKRRKPFLNVDISDI